MREKDILKRLSHPNIVKYYGYATCQSFIYVALEPVVEISPDGTSMITVPGCCCDDMRYTIIGFICACTCNVGGEQVEGHAH